MLYLKTNLPGWERVFRVAMGVIVAVMAFQFAPGAMWSWIGIGTGLVLAVTGFVGFCPMCAMVALVRDHLLAGGYLGSAAGQE